MATKTVTLTVCDTCNDEERIAEPYKITLPGRGNRTKRVDLCDEHALPVLQVVNPKAELGAIRRRKE